MTFTPTIVIHGPQGSGKAVLAAGLAKHFKPTCVVDDWQGGALPDGAMALTNHIPPDFPAGSIIVIDIDTACAWAGCQKEAA